MLTAEQVLALAPDPGAAKAGSGLGRASKWRSLGRSEDALFGEIQGSGTSAYQVRIDLSGPAFKCSCPSRKFPCKHALGLMLVAADDPGAVTERAAPEWLTEWLESRATAAERAGRRAQARAEGKPPDPEAQARRAANRDSRMRSGLDDLALWLRDLMRMGLAEAVTRSPSFWERAAARLVDAQAPGAARRVRELGHAAASGEGWQSRLLEGVGRLHLLIEGYRRLEQLPDTLRADVLAAVGVTVPRESVLAGGSVRDTWSVIGERVEVDERLRTQRTWLWGERSERLALILSFAAGTQPLDRSFLIGTRVDAELAFYPGSVPLRAVLATQHGAPVPGARLPPAAAPRAALAGHGTAIASCPWLEQWPLSLGPVTPRPEWELVGEDGTAVPIDDRFDDGWSLVAVGGGTPLAVFGEWDGERLLPLAVTTPSRTFFVAHAGDQAHLVAAAGAAA